MPDSRPYIFSWKKYENLITADLICSGCTSPALWENYIELLEKKYHSKVVKVNFRDKYYGWNYFSLSLQFQSGRIYRRIFANDQWAKLFLDAWGMRECCYCCGYKSYNHISDFTLGDFWGVQYEYPGLSDDKGLSLVLMQSEKADDIWKELDTIKSRKIDGSIVERRNSAVTKSAARPDFRDRFWQDYVCMDFDRLLDRYCRIPVWKRSDNVYLLYWNTRLRLGRIYRKLVHRP